MLFSSTKKNHEKAVSIYNAAVVDLQSRCDALNATQKECVAALKDIEGVINNIANTPKKIDRSVAKIEIKRISYRDTKSFTKEAIFNAAVNGVVAGAGIGAALAAIRSSNKVFRLILLPLSLLLLLISIFSFRKKDKEITIDANSDIKTLNSSTAQIHKKSALVVKIHIETTSLHNNLLQQISEARHFVGKDFKDMSRDEKLRLGTIVNNTLSLAKKLTETAEQNKES